MMKKSLLLFGLLCCGAGGVVLASTTDNVEALSEFLPTDEEVLAIEMAKHNDEVANIVKKYVHERIVDSGGFKTIDEIGERIHKLWNIVNEMYNTYGREAMRKMFGFEGKVKKEFCIHGRVDKLKKRYEDGR